MQQLLNISGWHFFPEQKNSNHQFLPTSVKLLLRQILQLLESWSTSYCMRAPLISGQDIECCLRHTVSGSMWPSALKSHPK